MALLPDPVDTGSLSPEARPVLQALRARRGAVGDLWRSLLNHPELAARLEPLGTFLRYDGVLPPDLREAVILRTAQASRCGYEQAQHAPLAGRAGLSPAAVEALARGAVPEDATPLQAAVLRATDCVLEGISIPEDLQATLTAALGLEGVVELAVLAGYYRLIAGIILAFEVRRGPR